MINITYALELTGGIITGGAFSIEGSLECGAGSMQQHYSGSYSITPTQQTQVLNTEGKTLDNDIVVHPIPSNYGLISWNGLSLMVS